MSREVSSTSPLVGKETAKPVSRIDTRYSWCESCCCCFRYLFQEAVEEPPEVTNNTFDYSTNARKMPQTKVVKENGADKPPERAFIIAEHETYGYMLLTAFKKRKGRHHQLPGGHIDETDPSPAFAAVRELYEETGIDLRKSLDRLQQLHVKGKLVWKDRVYFYLQLSNDDRVGSSSPNTGEDFTLKLSDEHIGYRFEKSRSKAAKLLALHSGGKSQTAMETYQK